MDDLDRALCEAWGRVSARVRGDRVEGVRRALRRGAADFSRPVRPWCLCLRAGDTRLESWGFVPKYSEAWRETHEIVLYSETIRRLCRPVVIDWPGVDWVRAADKLGRSCGVLAQWIKKGHLRCKRYSAVSCGKRGPAVPHVWAPWPIDPNADHGRGPHEAWGTAWQGLWERVPDGLGFAVKRTPRWYTKGVHRGWMFVCPGLSGETGEDEEGRVVGPPGCGRLVERLYIPMPVWTVGDALGEAGGGGDPLEVRFAFPGGGVRSGEGEREGSDGSGQRSVVAEGMGGGVGGRWQPACAKCHRVNAVNMGTAIGWNVFVSHMSGGLLYGHEVERPRGFGAAAEAPGRRQAVRRAGELWAKREEIAAELAAGKTIGRLSKELGVTHRTLDTFVKREGIPVAVRRVQRARGKKMGIGAGGERRGRGGRRVA